MGKFALLLMSYWMGHIHWTMSELGPQIKVGQTFRSYWMFTTCANWGRIRMYHHAVLERLDSPLCMKGTWSQIKIDWKVKIGYWSSKNKPDPENMLVILHIFDDQTYTTLEHKEIQNRSPQDVLLGHVDYFQIKANMRCLDSITDSMDVNLGKFCETLKDRKTWHGAV